MSLTLKIKHILAGLAVIANTACAKPEIFAIRHIDTRLAAYVQVFERSVMVLHNTDTIVFGETKENTAAYVQLQNSGYYTMVVNKNVWDQYDESTRVMLIFHELGHSECGLDHDDSVDDNGYPLSFMHYQVFSPTIEAIDSWYIPNMVKECTMIQFVDEALYAPTKTSDSEVTQDNK
jgi:hypothetical protein